MSIFDNIDINISIKDEIKKFIKSNYEYNGDIVISDKPNKNGLYEVLSDRSVYVKKYNITSLTNGLFEWNTIEKDFSCIGCEVLKSLKGAPKYVGGYFSCALCGNLKSLEGAPEEVYGNFSCYKCGSLNSLKGAPKFVGQMFYCYSNEIEFTEADIRAVTDVRINVINDSVLF